MLSITTFSPEGYDLYGRECLETLTEYFPGRVVAYVEMPPRGAAYRAELRNFFSIPKWAEWFERVKRHPGSDGHGPNGYDFRFNAQKFCRKAFAQDAVFDEDDYVFWFDADSVVKKPIPEDFLKGLLADSAVAYLGRKLTYTETGFVGFNTRHQNFTTFRENYLPWIISGRIFSQLKGWHDCIAFDHAREGVAGNNLSPRGQNYDAVMEQSVMHEYIEHFKGNRKFDKSEQPKIRWA